MIVMSAELRGMDEIERDIAMREARLIEGADRAVMEIARYGADLIRESLLAAPSPSGPGGAPGVRTGNLLRSVRAEHQQGTLTAAIRAGTRGKLKKGAPHWYLLEFGTVKMAARPFIRPAGKQAAEHGQKLIDALVRAVSK